MILDQYGNPIQHGVASASGKWAERRWEAARTDRLNEAHWTYADGRDINDDLVGYGEKLWQRTTYEVSNNPIVRGMIESHQADMIGAEGPTLRVVTSEDDADNKYARALEEIWREWWYDCDINGIIAGPDLLRQWIRMFWQCGDAVTQLVNDSSADTLIKTRVHSIHPRRLATPPERGSDFNLFMGVERTPTGRPTAYHIDQSAQGEFAMELPRYERINASNVLHVFEQEEPGQARGVPWLASVLQVAADLRDFDVQVLDAARQAADGGVILYSDHPDVEPVIVNEDVPAPRRRQQTAPPGWKPMQIQSQQPQNNYVEYRKERHRDLGRPMAMPAMVVRLDSSSHNFSSSRFDGQMYGRVCAAKQAWLVRSGLNRLVRTIEKEALRVGQSGESKRLGRRPERVELQWGWPPPLYRAADPVKEAKAATARMANGTSTLSQELASEGKTLAGQLEEATREAREIHKAITQLRDAGVELRDAGILQPASTQEQERAAADKWIAGLFSLAIEENSDNLKVETSNAS